jgi:hypothetical protein
MRPQGLIAIPSQPKPTWFHSHPRGADSSHKSTEADLISPSESSRLGRSDRCGISPIKPIVHFEAYEVLRRTEARPNPILSQLDASREIPKGSSKVTCICRQCSYRRQERALGLVKGVSAIPRNRIDLVDTFWPHCTQILDPLKTAGRTP